MIFPTLNLRSRTDPEDALGRMERAINDRNHRLSAGISISNRFDEVRGALVVSQGNGKYLRVRHVVEAATPIPDLVRDGCLDIYHGRQRDQGEIAQLVSDLAEPQATVLELLKCRAGKYVDRVLAVAVCDPGIWGHDFDGRTSYAPFCDATRLAELSGVTVIDAFPSRDLAVAGNGSFLEALPCWILFADRDPRVASQSRMVVSIGDQCRSYFLPASDGLDSEVPQIKSSVSVGVGFLNELVSRRFPELPKTSEMDRFYADGIQMPALLEIWESVLSEIAPARDSTKLAPPVRTVSSLQVENEQVTNRLADEAEAYLADNADGFSNVLRTGIRLIADQCLDRMKTVRQAKVVGNTMAGQFLVSSPVQYEAGVVNQLMQLTDGASVATTRKTGLVQGELTPVVAAVLGLFHIDQMPANIPWLTGSSCQRILGRLTPGRPSNWRQLVRVMADFQPAPMKLKDAV